MIEVVKRKVKVALVSPSALQSAEYYRALIGVCHG